jgi:hypothetical protein
MMVPASVIRQLRIMSTPGPATLDEARRRLGIPLAIFEQELRHHLLVWEIVHGARPRSRHAR